MNDRNAMFSALLNASMWKFFLGFYDGKNKKSLRIVSVMGSKAQRDKNKKKDRVWEIELGVSQEEVLENDIIVLL